MSIDRLIEIAQVGQDQTIVSNADEFSGRVPEDLIRFWKEYGTCYFPESRVTWTIPALFDSHIEMLLANVPILDARDFAAVSYNCFGMIDLWHKNCEHWVYDRQTGWLDNQSAREKFRLPPSHTELQDLFSESGLGMPPEGSVEYEAILKMEPADLTQILGFGALSDAVHEILDQEYEPILPALEGKFGITTRDVIFLCTDPEGSQSASEFQSVSIMSALKSLPNQVMVSIQVDQEAVRNEVFSTNQG